MAWIYHLTARCKNENIARHMAWKYGGQTFMFSSENGTLYNGEVCRLSAGPNQINNLNPDDDWWVDIMPSGVTRSGIANEQEAKRADEFCNVMYGMLRNEPYFDYAIIGTEVGEFRSMKEMEKDLKDSADYHGGCDHLGNVLWLPEGHPGDDPVKNLDGLVVSIEMLQRLKGENNETWGRPFQDFSVTHRWIPKKSELLDLKRRLKEHEKCTSSQTSGGSG